MKSNGPVAPEMDPLVYSRHHLESFNYLIDQGLDIICKNFKPVEFIVPGSGLLHESVKVSLDCILPGSPSVHPYQCRLTGSTYTIPLFVTVKIMLDDSQVSNKSCQTGVSSVRPPSPESL